MRVAVVGAGIHGASAARALSERGHSVTLFDQFRPGHRLGSSHGRSRIVRRAYPDRLYTEYMAEGYPLWAELERASGTRLMHEVGLLYFGAKDSHDLQSVVRGLQELRVEHEVLNFEQSSASFLMPALARDEIGVFTPEAGWVDADLALDATINLANSAGCELVSQLVRQADRPEADRTLICPGAWIRNWWSDAPVRVTLQTVAYLQGCQDGPAWIEHSRDFLYGFPNESVTAGRFKVGVHRQGRQVDPANPDREPSTADLELIRDLARRRFGIEDPEVVETVGCLYTNTPSEDFIFRQLDGHTLLISACSGHGFKFGPWIGQVAADLLEGRRQISDFPRFAA